MASDIEIQRRLLDAAHELGSAAELAGAQECSDRLGGIRAALTDGKLRMVLVGEFGNGKSTVANSLLRVNLFPMGSVAATRAPARATHGAGQRMVLVYEDGVRSETQPGDVSDLGIDLVERLDRIEIETDAPFLEHCVLTDTPGLGSSGQYAAGVHAGALADAHCIICVLNCDRLLSMTERTYIAEHLARCGAARLCFVLNRADGKSTEELAALLDRARHLLTGIVPEPVIIPYSGLQAIQHGSSKNGRRNTTAEWGELRALVTEEWIADRRSIISESSALKIGQIASTLDSRLKHLDESAEERLTRLKTDVERAERESLELQERAEATSRRSTAAVQALREQFVVGLKDYALKLRENVPAEVMQVPVEDARKFLPFYIQDSLRRAVSENDQPLNSAVAQALEPLGEEIGPAIQKLISGFQVDVEPPVIPLYVSRDRAVLTQGGLYVLMAGTLVMFGDFPIGALMLAGGLMTREIGRQLEAADRRTALSDSAQRLVHGSITTMEGSVTEQFTELESALANIVRETFAPQLALNHAHLAELQSEQAEATDERLAMASSVEKARALLESSRRLMADGGIPKAIERQPENANTLHESIDRSSSVPELSLDPSGGPQPAGDAGTKTSRRTPRGSQQTAAPADKGAVSVDKGAGSPAVVTGENSDPNGSETGTTDAGA